MADPFSPSQSAAVAIHRTRYEHQLYHGDCTGSSQPHPGVVPWSGPRNGSNMDSSNGGNGSGNKSGAMDMREGIVGGAIVAGVAVL